MRAAVLDHYGEGAPNVRDFPDPVPAPGEALVRLHAAALNRVDLYMRGGGQGITHRLPLVLGLDGAGEVVSAPPESGLAPGDRVLLYPAAFCGRCAECQRGEQPFCERVRIAGEHRHGTFAELISHARRLLAADPGGPRLRGCRGAACRLPDRLADAVRLGPAARPWADRAGDGRGRRGGHRLRAARAPAPGRGCWRHPRRRRSWPTPPRSAPR